MPDDLQLGWFHPFANWALRTLYAILLDLDIRGLELVPQTGPLIIVINHTHFLDPLIPCALFRSDLYPMAKAEIFEGRWRWMFEAYSAFPIRRGEADLTALKHAFKILRAGHAMLMAPEGTRARTGGLQPAHEGAGLIAARTGAPILPVAVWGGRAFVPRLTHLQQVPVHVRVGAPQVVRPGERKPTRADIAATTDEIMYTIAAMLPPEYRGVYADVEGFAPRHLLPYHPAAPAHGVTQEVMHLTE